MTGELHPAVGMAGVFLVRLEGDPTGAWQLCSPSMRLAVCQDEHPDDPWPFVGDPDDALLDRLRRDVWAYARPCLTSDPDALFDLISLRWSILDRYVLVCVSDLRYPGSKEIPLVLTRDADEWQIAGIGGVWEPSPAGPVCRLVAGLAVTA